MNSGYLLPAARIYLLNARVASYFLFIIVIYAFAANGHMSLADIRHVVSSKPFIMFGIFIPYFIVSNLHMISSKYLTETLPCGRKPFVTISFLLAGLASLVTSIGFIGNGYIYPMCLIKGIAVVFGIFFFISWSSLKPKKAMIALISLPVILIAADKSGFKPRDIVISTFHSWGYPNNPILIASLLALEFILLAVLYRKYIKLSFADFEKQEITARNQEREIYKNSKIIKLLDMVKVKPLEVRNIKFHELPNFYSKVTWRFVDFKKGLLMLSPFFILLLSLPLWTKSETGDQIFFVSMTIISLTALIGGLFIAAWLRVNPYEYMLPFSRKECISFPIRASYLLLGRTLLQAYAFLAVYIYFLDREFLLSGAFIKVMYTSTLCGLLVAAGFKLLGVITQYMSVLSQKVAKAVPVFTLMGIFVFIKLIHNFSLNSIMLLNPHDVAIISMIFVPLILLIDYLQYLVLSTTDIIYIPKK